jgi:hypothetical protein
MSSVCVCSCVLLSDKGRQGSEQDILKESHIAARLVSIKLSHWEDRVCVVNPWKTACSCQGQFNLNLNPRAVLAASNQYEFELLLT